MDDSRRGANKLPAVFIFRSRPQAHWDNHTEGVWRRRVGVESWFLNSKFYAITVLRFTLKLIWTQMELGGFLTLHTLHKT